MSRTATCMPKSNIIIRDMAKQTFKDYGFDAYDQFCRTNGPESRISWIERRRPRVKTEEEATNTVLAQA